MAEFLHMGGYAAFVWSSYAIALVVLLPGILLPLMQHKSTIQKLKGKMKRAQADLKQKQENL